MTGRFATAGSTGTIWRWCPPAIALATVAALSALTPSPADAQARKDTQVRKAAPPARPAQAPEATAPRQAGEAIMAIVSIKSQRVTIYDADGWVLSAPVSTGTKGRETPAGVFAVVEKNKDHRSNMYDDAWMPNMLRITWNGIALHGGPLPGYAASHGCVRLPFGFAEKLFDKIRMNTRIIISPNDAEPVAFSHPALFAPNAEALAAARTRAETLAREADEAAKMAKQTKKAATKSPTVAMTKLEQANTRAKAELKAAEKRLATAKTDQAKAKAEDQQQKAAARAEELGKQLAAATAARDARLSLVPVSVFISRATQKLYIRRNTQEKLPDAGELFDAIELPVTIRDPNQPIGTHVITAVASTDGGLRWTAVTVDGAGDAKDALDRITIPQEVIDRFGPTALPRSSIIISDEPLHRETNYRTEFVVALNNQPQGGLITRPRTPPEDRIAANERGGGGGFFGGLFGQPAPQPDTRRRGPNDQQNSPFIFRR
ncbi:MAG TPA: L,D-transpeptidase family protein [Xanthobacteraceae bacterium]|nr:L,D-transpeptidase family protein [Xanthobacteraceae bacterium]